MRGSCIECDKLCAKLYREKNKDVLRLKNKKHTEKYREKNRDKANEYAKIYKKENEETLQEYREKNRDKANYYAKKYREENSEIISNYQVNYRDENSEEIKINRDNSKDKSKKYRKDNKEKLKAYAKIYKLENRDKINEYIRNRRATEPLYKLSGNIRNLIKNSLKKQGHEKSKKTKEILGCSVREFKKHLEDRFESWMTWENYGMFNENYDTWQLDHITPISSATTKEELVKLNHYSNFQPLRAIDNILKSNKTN